MGVLMTYRMQVVQDDITDESDHSYDWFNTFLHECGYIDHNAPLDDYLAEWGGKNVFMSKFIEFETEEQAMIFLLRWAK